LGSLALPADFHGSRLFVLSHDLGREEEALSFD
jgi:hypothetical protein